MVRLLSNPKKLEAAQTAAGASVDPGIKTTTKMKQTP